jgi:two-component system, OmpR family, response regulator QseB
MRVLLVEDHAALREMIAGHLARRGFAIDTVPSAAEARAALAVISYDGLILDLSLPDVDGMTVLQAGLGGWSGARPDPSRDGFA